MIKKDAGLCPKCNAVLNGHENLVGDKPEPVAGDLTVCVYCATAFCLTADEFGVLQLADPLWDLLPPGAKVAVEKIQSQIREHRRTK